MRERMLVDFLMYLKYPLGLDYENEVSKFSEEIRYGNTYVRIENEWDYQQVIEKYQAVIRREAAKLLMNMNIVTDGEGYIYYNDILFAVFKYMLKDSIKVNSC